MARMPQIPPVEYAGEPASIPGRAELPDVTSAGRALGDIASMTDNLGDISAKRTAALQAQQARIAAQKQQIVDAVNATKAEGDYQAAAAQDYKALQQKYWDTPDSPKFKEELTQKLNERASGITDNEDFSPGVALHMARASGSINSQFLTRADRWSQGRSTQLAKSTVSSIEGDFVQSVGSLYTPEALTATIKDAHAKLDPLYDKVTPDAQKAKSGLDTKMMTAWAETRSADPHGAFAVLAALGDKSSVLQKLDPKTRATLTDKAQKSFEGGGVTAQLNALAAAHQDISDVLGLVSNSDPGYSTAALAKRQKIDQAIEATKNDPTIPEAARAGRIETLKTSQQILDVVDSMYRSKPGIFKQKVDGGVTGDLLARAKAPWMTDDTAVGDHLQDLLNLRRDAAQAHQAGTLSTRAYETIETKLQLALPKSEAAQDTGRFSHIGSGAFDWRSPQQAGNARMADMLDEKGAYGSLSQAARNEAWVSFFQQLNDAHKAGQNVTRQAAMGMADQALAYAASMGLK